MFVININNRIEYVAAEPIKVKPALAKLFRDILLLQQADLDKF